MESQSPSTAERRSQPGAAILLVEVVAEARLLQTAVGADPLHVAVEAGEEHGTHHTTVDQGAAVVVLVVGDRVAMVAEGVGDERDRRIVGAERRAREQETGGGVLERHLDTLTPRLVAAGVVDLVEDHDPALARACAGAGPTWRPGRR